MLQELEEKMNAWQRSIEESRRSADIITELIGAFPAKDLEAALLPSSDSPAPKRGLGAAWRMTSPCVVHAAGSPVVQSAPRLHIVQRPGHSIVTSLQHVGQATQAPQMLLGNSAVLGGLVEVQRVPQTVGQTVFVPELTFAAESPIGQLRESPATPVWGCASPLSAPSRTTATRASCQLRKCSP